MEIYILNIYAFQLSTTVTANPNHIRFFISAAPL